MSSEPVVGSRESEVGNRESGIGDWGLMIARPSTLNPSAVPLIVIRLFSCESIMALEDMSNDSTNFVPRG